MQPEPDKSADQRQAEASPLEYRDLREDWPPHRKQFVFIGGAALSCVTILGLVFLWIISNLNFGGGPTVTHWRFPAVVAVFAAIAWAAVLYRWRQVRPFWTGALAGIGVAILIEGICFIR